MKPSDLFGVVVRSVGLLMLIGLWVAFWSAICAAAGGNHFISALLIGVPLLCLGIWFLDGAESLVRIAYHELEDSEKGR